MKHSLGYVRICSCSFCLCPDSKLAGGLTVGSWTHSRLVECGRQDEIVCSLFGFVMMFRVGRDENLQEDLGEVDILLGNLGSPRSVVHSRYL